MNVPKESLVFDFFWGITVTFLVVLLVIIFLLCREAWHAFTSQGVVPIWHWLAFYFSSPFRGPLEDIFRFLKK